MRTLICNGLLAFIATSGALRAHNLQICKSNDLTGPVSGTFQFTVVGQQGTTAVQVGSCVTISDIGIGSFTVIEQSSAGVVVTGIAVEPSANMVSSDLGARSATLNIFDGSTTTVTFTNKANSTALSGPPSAPGRFTGGGSIFTDSGVRITHGFELHCNASEKPNNLEINWVSSRFHLDSLTAAACSVNPETGVATLIGTGTGSYNGTAGASIEFTITDAGEPGRSDFFSALITESGGSIVLSASGKLTFGNQQYHKK
jgi:hypothetical protein